MSVREDKMSFTLTFSDGSFGTVHYLANGHKSFPKERLEVFCAGRCAAARQFPHTTLATAGLGLRRCVYGVRQGSQS